MSHLIIEDSLYETIKKSGAFRFLENVGEVGVDLFQQNGVIKEIPIIRSISGVVNGCVAVKEYILFKKILRFLASIQTLKPEELNGFVARMDGLPQEKKRFSEMLFLSLDRLEDMDKAEYVGRAFKAFAKSQIALDVFFRFLNVIDRTFLPDLIVLQNLKQIGKPPETILLSLSNVGLLLIPTMPSYDSMNGYRITELGHSFIQNILRCEGKS